MTEEQGIQIINLLTEIQDNIPSSTFLFFFLNEIVTVIIVIAMIFLFFYAIFSLWNR